MATNQGAKSEYLEWVRKSDEDLLSLKSLVEHQDASPSTGCFLAQQAVEKLLKALMVRNGLEIEKTHDLVKLGNLLKEKEAGIVSLFDELAVLNRYYIETRYPGDFPEFSWKECEQALEFVESIRNFVLEKEVNHAR